MTRAEEYRRNAEEAEERAARAATDYEQQAFQRIASAWRQLAEQCMQAARRGR
jgi:hypothetical protein